ncbi:MAG: hypothetical protein GYA87_00810 [Christensenellaceae bacterium]|nr:hypothetical protein [Christensenellaceae bacterium]
MSHKKEDIMYCEKCKNIVNSTPCPLCKGKNVREIKEDDLVYIVEKRAMWAEMLMDVLRQEEIPFSYRNILGAALSMSVGREKESYIFYVPYIYLDKAKNIVESLFSGEGFEIDPEDSEIEYLEGNEELHDDEYEDLSVL